MPDKKSESSAKKRQDLAAKIIQEYDGHPERTRRTVEDEIRRIANPLSAADTDTNTADYVAEDHMFDTTVREALVIAKNGIMSRMFPFSNKWFSHKLTFDGKKEPDEKELRALEKVSDFQFRQLGQDNFYGAMADALNDYMNMGTTNIQLLKGKRRFANFKAMPKSTYYHELDNEGFADIIWMYFSWTAYEIKTKFGDKALPPKIKEALDADRPHERFQIINKIHRRDDFSTSPNALPWNREYESVWVSKVDKDIIGNSSVEGRRTIYMDGEFYNPYTIGRLMSRAGQSSGEGLTSMMLPTIRLANQKTINVEMAENLVVDPPWWDDESQPMGDNARLPGGTVNRDPFNPDSAPGPVQGLPKTGIDYEKSGLTLVRQIIKDAFFVSAFKMFTDRDVVTNRKTAFESRLIKAEQLSLLVTLLYNLSEEVVKPLLEKHLNLMIRFKKIPQEVIDDLPDNYEIELTSQFAKTIESTMAEDLLTAVEMAIQIDQVAPGTSKSTVRFNQAFKRVLLNMEIAVDDLYTTEESNELLDEQKNLEREAIQAEIANQGADALSKLE